MSCPLESDSWTLSMLSRTFLCVNTFEIIYSALLEDGAEKSGHLKITQGGKSHLGQDPVFTELEPKIPGHPAAWAWYDGIGKLSRAI